MEDQHAVLAIGLERTVGYVVIRVMHAQRFHLAVAELHRAREQQLELGCMMEMRRHVHPGQPYLHRLGSVGSAFQANPVLVALVPFPGLLPGYPSQIHDDVAFCR